MRVSRLLQLKHSQLSQKKKYETDCPWGPSLPMFCGFSPQFDPSEKLAYILCDVIWAILRHTNSILLGHNPKMVRINQIGGAPGTIRLINLMMQGLLENTATCVDTIRNEHVSKWKTRKDGCSITYLNVLE